MSTKIESYASNVISSTHSGVKSVSGSSDQANGSSAKVAAVRPTDSVRLTGDAKQLHELEQTIAAIPVVDHERVERVRQSLADGSYKMDPQAIAAKLVRWEWEFGKT